MRKTAQLWPTLAMTCVATLLVLLAPKPAFGALAPRPFPPSLQPSAGAAPQFSPFTQLRALGISAGDYFGAAVATSGTTTVVGVPYLDGGRAFVFGETSGAWRQMAMLRGTDTEAGDYFGISVAISGPTIVVGANGAEHSGRAYVFIKGTSGWHQTAELSGTGFGKGAAFGSSVAVSGDSVVVGAPLQNVFSGAAEVFGDGVGGWLPVARLTSDETSVGNYFGFAVAMAGDAIAVGAPGRLVGEGRAYIFKPSGHGWREEASIVGGDSAVGDDFGYSLALSGPTLVVGGPWHDSAGGAAYVFSLGARGVHQVAELKGRGTVAGDRFGSSVAISGSTIVVGAPRHGNGAGEAYMFDWAGGSWREAAAMTGPGTAVGDAFGTSAAVAGATVAVGASRHDGTDGAVYLSQETAPGAL